MEARWGGKVDIMMMTLNIEQVSSCLTAISISISPIVCSVINITEQTAFIRKKYLQNANARPLLRYLIGVMIFTSKGILDAGRSCSMTQ